MEQSSTDIRLDELTGRVGRFETDVKERFDKVDRRFERFEDNVDARFDGIDAKFDAKFDKLEARFDKWGRILATGVVAIAGSLVAKVLGL